MKRQLVLIAHNLRSAHNVGSLLRTAEGLGVEKVYLTGYSPYPKQKSDTRMLHVANKVHNRIAKTSLGAEKSIHAEHVFDITKLIDMLKAQNYTICALEQHEGSLSLLDHTPTAKTALIVGREVEGIEPEVIKQVDTVLEIPMLGKKESFNVTNAAAMAMYHLRFN